MRKPSGATLAANVKTSAARPRRPAPSDALTSMNSAATVSKPAVCLTAPAAPMKSPASAARLIRPSGDSAARKARIVSAASGQ
ncbi:MAG: hypothetical protein ABR863_13990 [Roseiarcus sp.]